MTAPPGKHEGVVLIVCLLILLLLGMLASTVYEVNLVQLKMAGNEEARTGALQRALAIVDAVLAREGNTPVRGAVGNRTCAVGSPDSSCDQKLMVVDDSAIPPDGEIGYYAVRQGPMESMLPVMDEATASSGTHYRAALLEVHASYDGTAVGLGRSEIVQGVLIKLVATPR